jgi:hypothetical protein
MNQMNQMTEHIIFNPLFLIFLIILSICFAIQIILENKIEHLRYLQSNPIGNEKINNRKKIEKYEKYNNNLFYPIIYCIFFLILQIFNYQTYGIY